MESLARFEGYADAFAVTQEDILERGLSHEPEFEVLVAHQANEEIIGMAVFYFIPFTFDLCPELVLKELYVRQASRGSGAGRALMSRLTEIAQARGCRRMRWLVLKGNESARRFYRSLGAHQDTKWENWMLDLRAPAVRKPK